MKVWLFRSLETVIQMQAGEALADPEDGEDHGTWLKRCGYCPNSCLRLGLAEANCCVDVHESDSDPNIFLCVLGLGLLHREVVCEGLPALLHFLRFVEPIVQLNVEHAEILDGLHRELLLVKPHVS